jgi:hypothetical protein
MAIKKKVTYSVSYVEGTDTLSTQLNRLLNDVVDLILDHHSELQVLDTITYGSERMTGAPLYSGGNANLFTNLFNNRFYQSDLVFIGTNEDNICLSIGFYDGELVIAMNMTPKVEASVTDVFSSKYRIVESVPLYAIGKVSRRFPSNSTNKYNYSIPYRIVDDNITLDVLYWNTEYSSGYSFINGAAESEGVKLIIFKTDEGNNVTGLGAAIQTWGYITGYRNNSKTGLLTWSFNENLIDNPPAQLSHASQYSSGIPDTVPDAVSTLVNGNAEIRQWYNTNNVDGVSMNYANFAIWHTLGLLNGSSSGTTFNYMPWVYNVRAVYGSPSTKDPSGSADTQFKTFMASPYNVPYLQPGQAYIRKMRIPGWNPYCKGEIYLFWTPSLSAYQSGDIIEIGNKQYAIITDGVVCWIARVA